MKPTIKTDETNFEREVLKSNQPSSWIFGLPGVAHASSAERSQ
jgi:hypothetical protein